MIDQKAGYMPHKSRKWKFLGQPLGRQIREQTVCRTRKLEGYWKYPYQRVIEVMCVKAWKYLLLP